MSIKVSEVSLPLHIAVEYSLTHMEGFWDGEKMATPYIAGKPGGGKSEMLKFACEKKAIGFLPITVGLIRPERFSGIPDFKREALYNNMGAQIGTELQTEWSVPEIVCAMREMSKRYEKVLVLYDDWHIAAPEIQASGFETFTYRSINGHAIPQNVGIMLAGNNSSLAGARAAYSAVMNRVCKIYVNTDFDHWRDKYAIRHNLNNEILSFLDTESYRHYFHGEEDAREPWPSPRSWTEGSRAIDRMSRSGFDLKSDIGNNVLLNIICAHVGNKAGSEFMTWHNIYSKIDAKRIFDTGRWTFPTKAIDRFAFGATCTDEFINRWAKKEKEPEKYKTAANNYCKMLGEWEKDNSDIALRAIRFLTVKDQNICSQLSRLPNFPEKILFNLLDSSSVLKGM